MLFFVGIEESCDLLGRELLDREEERRPARFHQQLAPQAKLGGLARPGFPQDHRAALLKNAVPGNDVPEVEQRQVPCYLVLLAALELEETPI